MGKLEIKIYGDPVLRKVAEPVEDFDGSLADLAQSMIATMKAEGGIGLAAPQVGVSRRLIVALQMKEIDDASAPPLVLVNPRIEYRSSETWTFEEGCLSLPGVSAPVVRPVRVEVSYSDLEGREHSLEAEGIFGRIIQHEIDHLDGRLFIDYLSTARKSLIKSKLKNLASGGRPM